MRNHRQRFLWFVCDSNFMWSRRCPSCCESGAGVGSGVGSGDEGSDHDDKADAHDEDDGGDGCDDGDGGVDDDGDAGSVQLVWHCAQHLPQLVE